MDRITSRDKPDAIARAAAQHESHLREALAIATRRAVRSAPLVRQLLRHAQVEGLASRLDSKVACVSFRVPRLKQSWHQLYPWSSLTDVTPAHTATSISWSLRESIRRYARANSRHGNA